MAISVIFLVFIALVLGVTTLGAVVFYGWMSSKIRNQAVSDATRIALQRTDALITQRLKEFEARQKTPEQDK
jgi:uncharacterized membrane protein YgcG